MCSRERGGKRIDFSASSRQRPLALGEIFPGVRKFERIVRNDA